MPTKLYLPPASTRARPLIGSPRGGHANCMARFFRSSGRLSSTVVLLFPIMLTVPGNVGRFSSCIACTLERASHAHAVVLRSGESCLASEGHITVRVASVLEPEARSALNLQRA